MHKYIVIYHTAEVNIRSYKHSTCSSDSLNSKYKCRDEMGKNTYLIKDSLDSTSSLDSLNSKYKCRDEMGKNTYLIKDSSCNHLRHYNVPPNHRPACSLISQQRCHPRAGNDSQGIRNSQAYT